jgi:hypothetical protein
MFDVLIVGAGQYYAQYRDTRLTLIRTIWPLRRKDFP